MQSGDTNNSNLGYLDEPATGRLTIQYSPNASTEITENPPRFTWLPTIEDGAQYILRIAKNSQYESETTLQFSGISLNFFTPDTVLTAGDYVWSYAVWNSETVNSSHGSARSSR